MLYIVQILATFTCGLFCGASIYINLVEHPARMSCGTRLAATEFAPSYKRATVMQVSLALLSFICSLIVWLSDQGALWLVAGILIFLVIPFTGFVILPTNNKLLAPSLDKDSEYANSLLVRWGRLHAVRSLLSLISFLMFLHALSSAARS